MDERITLAMELWDSIAPSNTPIELSEARQRDLERRLDAYRHDPRAGLPWGEVKTRLLERLG